MDATVIFDGVVAEIGDLFEETLRTAFGDNVGDLIAREDVDEDVVGDLGDVGADSDLSTTESDFDDIDFWDENTDGAFVVDAKKDLGADKRGDNSGVCGDFRHINGDLLGDIGDLAVCWAHFLPAPWS